MKVLCFAKLRDLAGADAIDVELPTASTVEDLRREIARQWPIFDSLLPKCAVAVNEEFADATVVLKPEDCVALLPPVSGG
jgi:molybdopterin converting factor subunit 1